MDNIFGKDYDSGNENESIEIECKDEGIPCTMEIAEEKEVDEANIDKELVPMKVKDHYMVRE